MKALWLSGFLAVTLLAGCGGGVPVIESPAQGAQYSIQQTQVIQVTLANQQYQDTTIQFLGTESVPEFVWQNAAGSYAQAFRNNGGGGFGNCTVQRPCTIFIIATRGDQKDFRTITIVP